MNFILFMLWWTFWWFTGFFIVRSIRIRRKRRKMIVEEFYRYQVQTKKGGDVERTFEEVFG